MGRLYFLNAIKKYNDLNQREEFPIIRKNLFPILHDWGEDAGSVDAHYFLQDIYFARKIHENSPSIHYDIGSRIDGFIAHLLSARIVKEIILLDIRPFGIEISGLNFIRTDATELEEIEDGSLMSISSLHAIEHFGLGRYGDSINPEGWRIALNAIQRKMAVGGYFYLGLPIGKVEKVCFNAHRIFSPQTIVNELSQLELLSFAYIHNCKIIESTIEDAQLGEYDCGLFIFRKIV